MGKKSVKAAVMTAPGKMELQEFPYPEPRHGAMAVLAKRILVLARAALELG